MPFRAIDVLREEGWMSAGVWVRALMSMDSVIGLGGGDQVSMAAVWSVSKYAYLGTTGRSI